MEARILSAILTCFNFLFVEGVIVGGYVNPKDNKFAVRIMDTQFAVWPYSFSGSVISNRHILTSAASIHNRRCDKLKVYPSSWTLNSTTHMAVKHCFFSGRYHGYRPFFFDLALIQTEADLLLSNDYAIIPLPPPNTKYPPGETLVKIFGWSEGEVSGYTHDKLRTTTAYIRDRDECTSIYRPVIGCEDDDRQIIPNKSFCLTGDANPLGVPCKGDAGGAVLINNTLAGVINAWVIDAEGNCKNPSPDTLVASNVVEHLGFIYNYVFPNLDRTNIHTVSEAQPEED